MGRFVDTSQGSSFENSSSFYNELLSGYIITQPVYRYQSLIA